ncbi:methyltransferase [Streptomyces glebosus]|uniref:Methyltransferase n=1 Tax=Streptomyces glebosus TaxID=249580 RepID=A0A640SRB5_9ACTN|nr:methyltransferase domain-containing protein [Streptomyces glebosus]GFE12801.1 methyltransferase [Streptomyces glebosus]GHG86904.1 methyltransferase [Streptomyces glebosus]
MTDHHADRPQEVRAFFASRAATWDTKFPGDGPAYAAGVAELGLQEGERVLDAGCGTGRALPALRSAVGPLGTVLGADLTPEMLEAAVRAGRDRDAALLLADVSRLPLPDAGLDAVFAAGLLSHLPDSAGGLTELARTVRPGGRLALFHPIGRAALASCGWDLIRYEDEDSRYLALAVRRG